MFFYPLVHTSASAGLSQHLFLYILLALYINHDIMYGRSYYIFNSCSSALHKRSLEPINKDLTLYTTPEWLQFCTAQEITSRTRAK